MARTVSDEPRRSVNVTDPAPVRRGGSVTLPEGASPEDIDGALRKPAPTPEKESK